MDRKALNKWRRVANALPNTPAELPIPLASLVGDGVRAAHFVRYYWEPEATPAGKVLRPGLVEVDGQRGLTSKTAAELEELAEALQTAWIDAFMCTEKGARARRRLALRNRIAALLHERILAVRSAARFVFRHHPAIQKQAASRYERQKLAQERARITRAENKQKRAAARAAEEAARRAAAAYAQCVPSRKLEVFPCTFTR